MKIILSPTKKMRQDTDSLPIQGLPAELGKTRQILRRLKEMSPRQLQSLWDCNDTIAGQNIARLEQMDLEAGLTPAILAYEGIAFQYMAPSVFEDRQLTYVQQHLRILSGFYGVLKPMDGVRPYRLEMQAPLDVEGASDLYNFWGSALYRQVRDGDGMIINLASKEYSRCIEKYLAAGDRMVTCIFAENVGGKMVQKGTFAKMARGEMVRFLAECQAADPAEMENFNRLGFHFRPDLSDGAKYLFERIPE